MAFTDQGGDGDHSGGHGQEEIADGDLLARQIFYKTSFEADCVSVNALLVFAGNRNDDGSFDESLFLLRLAGPDQLHEAGCAAAVKQNDRVREKRRNKGLTEEPVSGEDRRYYCGFTAATAADLRLSGANYNVELLHREEGGMVSHVVVYLRPAGAAKLHANDRTEAGRRLALAFSSPQAHVCGVDQDDAHHPVTKFGTQVLEASAA